MSEIQEAKGIAELEIRSNGCRLKRTKLIDTLFFSLNDFTFINTLSHSVLHVILLLVILI